MSLRPILTNICAAINDERRPDLVVEKMPFDGVIRGIRLASDHGPPGSMMVKKVMVNDRELAPAILGGLLEGLPSDLEWGHVAKDDTVRITVESTHSKNMAWDPVQAVLLVEPRSPRTERILMVRSKRVRARDRACVAWYGASTKTTVHRVVVTPDSASSCMVMLDVLGVEQYSALKIAAPASFFGTTNMQVKLESEWTIKVWLTNPFDFDLDASVTIYGGEDNDG